MTDSLHVQPEQEGSERASGDAKGTMDAVDVGVDFASCTQGDNCDVVK